MKKTLKDRLEARTLEQLRSLYSDLTRRPTSIGKNARTEKTKAAAKQRLVGWTAKILRQLAEGGKEESAVQILKRLSPKQGDLLAAKKPAKKKRRGRGRPMVAPDPSKPAPVYRGKVRPCVKCGKEGMHTCCMTPGCGTSAKGRKKIKKFFGFRLLSQQNVYAPQPNCKVCRGKLGKASRAAKAVA